MPPDLPNIISLYPISAGGGGREGIQNHHSDVIDRAIATKFGRGVVFGRYKGVPSFIVLA